MAEKIDQQREVSGGRCIAVFGANSAVGKAVARLHAQRGDRLLLLARNADKLNTVEQDLSARGAAQVESLAIDLADVTAQDQAWEWLRSHRQQVDRYYFFYGVLPDQKACESSATAALQALNTNFNSVVAWLTPIANELQANAGGELVVISSVAGDRGRQSNYVYGSAKGALSLFMQGLRNRLAPLGCTVLNVKPGFIDTPMTDGMDKSGALWAKPEQVARDIVVAADKGKDEIYTPWFWRYIMWIIKNIPEFVFKKLTL